VTTPSPKDDVFAQIMARQLFRQNNGEDGVNNSLVRDAALFSLHCNSFGFAKHS